MSAVTVAEQADAMRAAADMADAFAHLPAAWITVNPIWPGRVDVSLHDGLGAFEPWREALHIPAEVVEFSSLPSQISLRAMGAFSGAAVELVGFGEPLAEPPAAESRAAGAEAAA